ncbi:syntaxin-binding protein 5-like isoform X1 [Falco biarmicus]|uniref:syntaxin-binding protein 5-like isoform X1 n=1 Tax=Falco peregrinus TaxID=8954 RepID=UPI000FFB8D18|nr:syntaxin-binding protein 5-like isoform X1 [Falco peregrinus]XP_027672731.1 syntaxin-binding protein 5-like isoform X1 [Falco cherrug]XP_037243345.1 syntaxin-binding protein 5-like isoform X1 [Falco rusticolus]XP_040453027.1 syntaxin-binding protein 5-like isoform X1 [Falco naumanni]XP_056195615.1 syntaxin-binding protein 5-like isoform X1 [Falco biarmicus]
MKKFNFRKVLDGLTASSPGGSSGGGGGGGSGAGGGSVHPGGTAGAAGTPRDEIQETLTSDYFQICKTVRHGFPYLPTALAFDPVQKILAIGTRTGAIRILGRPGVDCYCQHESGAAVLQLQFLINEGALVSASADDALHLWNLRQKRPAILHSLKFNRERITYCHLPFQSKWLYVGTERGNTHIVNIESFILSGYVIMWNKAIELSTKTHPGPVVHLSDSPRDEGKLLIGYENGTVVLWDLRSKRADLRAYYDEAIHSVAWHHEGKQFMCSHSDGSLTLWNLKSPNRPFQTTIPHGKIQRDGKKPESCKPILKVEYKTCKNSEPFVIFSGGLSYDKACRRPSLTIMHGKAITVLEMDHPIVDFLTLCETPYPNEFQEPYAVVVLLEKDLIVVDLTQSNFPIFENPYPIDIHESPVTCTEYFADCPPDLIPVLYSVGAKHKKQGYSNKEWPISGGAWNLGAQTYPEIIITGHADGSVKFWDASAITLQMLYKLKTSKVFEKQKVGEGKATAEIVEEDPFAVQMMCWCPESRIFCVAGVSAYVVVYRFSKHEVNTEIASLEVRLQYEVEDIITPEPEIIPAFPDASSQLPSVKSLSGSTNTVACEGTMKDSIPCLSVKTRPVRMPPGYQADLVIQLVWVDGEPPQQITSLAVNSAYGLVAFGNCNGLAVVDIMQKTVLLSMGTLDLYGSSDPYQRQPRSPRKSKQFAADNFCMRGLSNFYPDLTKRIRTSYQSLTELSDSPVSLELERCKSPTSGKDHVNGHCTSPTSQSCSSGKRLSSADVSKANRRGPGRPPFRKAQSAACMEISLPVTTEENRENSFSRSRSSSVSSIDRDSKEAITALYFMESFARKNDSAVSPCLWVGTGLGMVLILSLNLPASDDSRQSEPVMVSPSGTVLTLKGAVLTFACLDCMGTLTHPPYEVWRDPHSADDGEKARKRKLVMHSPSSSQDMSDHQFAVICSEKQAKVFSLPSQTCLYVHNITETSFLLQADVVTLCNSVCLACFCANGHIMTLSLPSLRPLLDINYLPVTDMRIARTFCFTNEGQALYLSSPTEIQRLTYSQEMCDNLQDMLGDLFTPVETPEAQNRGFLKGLFGGSGQAFDREELFGEATAGKASRSLAQHIPGSGGIEGVRGAAGGVIGDLTRARIALDERGQKLGELDERTASMMASAEAFSKHAHEVMLKYKDKKWYQF